MQRSVLVSLVLLVLSITGCGGGGGGGGATTVTVSGLASKGPFVSGTVTIYDVSGGIDAKVEIDNRAINLEGIYSIPIPASNTPIMIEVAEGSVYQDEAKGGATREERRTTLDTPLRAILPSVAANTTVSVTPFTELAVRKAELAGSLTASVINEANTLIALQYNLPNILTTTPVDASLDITSTDQDAINYGLALAAVSQMAQGSNVDTALNALEVNGNLVSTESSDAFKSSLDTFLQSTNNLNIGRYPNISATSFTSVGTATPTTADVEVSLNRDFSTKKVSFLNFRIRINPANSVNVSSTPGLTLLNGAADNKAVVGIASYGGTQDLFTLIINRTDSINGFQVLPGVPFLKVTFPVQEGVPTFVPSLEALSNITPEPIGFIVPGSDDSELPSPPVTASDFSLTVTYKDSAGNPI